MGCSAQRGKPALFLFLSLSNAQMQAYSQERHLDRYTRYHFLDLRICLEDIIELF